MIVLRSFMHVLFSLAFAYSVLMARGRGARATVIRVRGRIHHLGGDVVVHGQPREKQRAASSEPVTRWSLWVVGLALLAVVPVGLLMLVQAVLDEDFQTELVRAAAGGGSLATALWWAARHGFFAALKIGLGGRFGGGGVEARN